MRRPVVNILMAMAVALGGMSSAAPASATAGCGALYYPTVETVGGYEQREWIHGQTMVITAHGYLGGNCPSGSTDQITNWALKLYLPACGYQPVLATGSSTIGTYGKPGESLASETVTIPEQCPPGSEYTYSPNVGTGGGFVTLSGTTSSGTGTAVSNFTIIDGVPTQACPAGQATGDTKCGEPGGDPVNTLTGAFMYADRDFAMPVRGGSLEVWRSYDSQLTRALGMGAGWTYAYTDSLVVQAGVKVTWRTSQGASIEFPISYGTNWQAPFGNTARLTQNANGSFTVKTEDLWSLDFTSAGVFTKATDRNGQATTISRDGDGRVSTVSRSGRTLTYAYNAGGDLTSVTATGSGSGSAVTEYTYSGGRLASATKPDGSETLYDYDSSGRLASIRNASTTTPQMQVAYGTNGRVTSQTDGNGKVTTWGWDAATKTSTMTDPRGGQWKDVYANSWLIKQIDPTGVTTTYDWTEAGKLFRVRAPGGQDNTFVYDGSGRLTARIDANGRASQLTYAGSYLDPSSQIDVAGRTTSYGYDTNRNLKTVTPPITSAKTTTTYATGTFDVTGFTDPTQQTTTFSHDATTGDLTSVTSPLGDETTSELDAFGQVVAVTPPAGNVSGASGDWSTDYERDGVGRVTKVTDPRGAIATYTYDDFGRVKTAKDARNNVTAYDYDNARHLTKVTNPDDSTEEFTYDDNGNVATAKDGRGHIRTFGYDAANRVTSVDVEGRTWEYTYDSAGRRTTTEAPSGRTVTVDYDERSLPTEIDYSDSTPDVTIEYDALGRRDSVSDGTGTWEYTYDNLDRPTTVDHGSEQWTYTWDNAGHLTSRKAPGQQATGYTYDNDGRLTKVTRNGTDLATYTYDTADNKVTRTLDNGIVTVETFDRSGNLASSVEKNSSGDVTHSLTYERDLQGNPTKVTDADDVVTVQQFDDRNRLTKVCHDTTTCDGATDFIDYSYDANNNITEETRPSGTVSRSYDDHDQLTQETDGTATRTFDYDDDGNRTSDGTTSYTVNAAGQVTSSTAGSDTAEFTYNAAGLLASETTGGSTTKYDYDPISAQLVGQRSGGNVTHQYVYGREAIAMTTSGGTDYYTTNELGSIIATRDDSAALQKAYTYEPYGKITDQSGSGADSPLQYTGGLALGADTYRFGLRHYDSASATFTTPDPADTGETYSYASGNPAVFNDPLGLAPVTPGGVPNLDSLLGGGPSQAWDDLVNSSVVRKHAPATFYYASGINLSRAYKPGPIDTAIATGIGFLGPGKFARLGKALLGRSAAKSVDDLPTVSWGQQSKHFPGHPNFIPGRSTLTANPETLIQRAGTGRPVGSVPRGQAGFKERIDFGDSIGNYVSRDGTSSPTSIGILHYRADGSVHIIPGRPQ